MPKIVINNGRSQDEVIEDLRNNAKSGGHDIIPFIGAGPSMILGLPSWPKLVSDYATLVTYPHDCEAQFEKFDRSWAKVAEDIFVHSGGDLDAYRNHMGQMHPTEAEWTNFHFSLVGNFKRIITTNYDYALENAYREYFRTEANPNPNCLYFPDTLDAMNFREGSIAYIHGQIRVRAFVFRESEYQYAYIQHTTIEDFLRQVMKLHYLLFVGFSFDDPIFRDAIQKICNKRKSELEERTRVFGSDHNLEPPKSYIILSHKDMETTYTQKALTTFGIGPAAQAKYFTQMDDGTFDLTSEVDIEKEPFFLQKDFKKEYGRIKFNTERLNYLNDLNFDILLYDSKNRTEIVGVLKKINQPETSASENLPDFSTNV